MTGMQPESADDFYARVRAATDSEGRLTVGARLMSHSYLYKRPCTTGGPGRTMEA
jgi:hypothetical protein